MLSRWSNSVFSRVMAWKKPLAPELWILQPLLSIIHPTVEPKKSSYIPAAALSLDFAEAIVISNAEAEEGEKEGKNPRVSHNAGN